MIMKYNEYDNPIMWSKEVGKQSSESRMTFTQWDFTWHNNTFMKGGVQLYIT